MPTVETVAYAQSTPTRFQTLGLSISVFKPDIRPDGPYYNPRGHLLYDDLATYITSYGHEIAADGGFTTANITLNATQSQVEDWVISGLGRHIEVYDESHGLVWEGFVNSVSANIGSLSVTIGPLMNVANQVVVVYTPVDPTTDPPATGPETETPAVVDDDSQRRWGILETVYSAGQTQDAGATQIANTLLGDAKWPARSESLAIGAGSTPTVSLECAGYYAFLDRYIFNDATTSTESISTRIQRALAADPNEIFSSSYAHIEENSFLTPARERDNATALTIIKEATVIGDANDRRAFFAIYEERTPYYYTIPSTVKYSHRISDESQRVELYRGGTQVRPWAVRPGDWVFLPDYLFGQSATPHELASDSRMIFVESVKYTMPYGLNLNGSRYSTLPQLLAKRGMIGGL